MNEKLTIRDIAGFCPEEAVWKLLADVSEAAASGVLCALSPETVVCDGNTFIIERDQEPLSGFIAPEVKDSSIIGEPQMTWSLGALAYFAATGRQLFGGRGSAYQREHPSAALPGLPKKFCRIASLVRACLDVNPDKRPRMDALHEQAQRGHASCKSDGISSRSTIVNTYKRTSDTIGDKWPEEMEEI